MQFEQLYLDCLAQASYLVGDGDECAIVDPRRDVEIYLEAASARGMAISHVIETHLHADFVSGHIELARRTGAQIYICHRAGAEFEHQAVQDGDEIAMGDVVLRFLETPGHTPESVCVLVFDRSQSEDRPVKVLTGDTLFIGDVGRPDLVGSKGFSAEEMAGMMYESLTAKLLVLPDETEVYPGHGAGSACGRSMSTERSSTIGAQKLSNLALQPMERDAFIAMQTAGLAPPPRYFSHSATLNRQGAKALDELPAQAALDAEQVSALLSSGSIVLDTRDAAAFGAGHVPGSVNIGLAGNFAPWVGGLVDVGTSLVLVTESDEAVAQAVTRLARVGHEAVAGYLAGGFAAWTAAGHESATLRQITVDELAVRLADADDSLAVLDVRQPGEHTDGHVPGAVNVPVREVEDRSAEFDQERPLALICASGYRSSAAASQLARHGFTDLLNVVGGTAGWVEAGHSVQTSDAACAPTEEA